ncbi:zeta toxin family protein [Comamonas thiooxydans]|uniref:zeta toxin family protein n=1 Tax=Comamonas thiooxydans TaxID=363952 RepID=UPI001C0EADA4|nr:zeta toxin family protein [Comamonas thiooxydans]
MSAPIPRLRMFAGPNGSGKSTIKDMLPQQWLGIYVNADEIEKSIRVDGYLSLAEFAVEATAEELQAFLQASTLLEKAGLLAQASQLALVDGRVVFGPVAVNSYWASVLADFIRHKLLASRASFTFETVMSSPDKVAFLQKAQQLGYRTYLYFVATEDADINVSRVKYRVQVGGHPVAEDKIRSRYVRSLELLPQAVTYADRAYIFDNSGAERVWVAEVTDGLEIEMKTDEMPAWFKAALWDKFE